jgi:hypothetical protein
MKEEIYNALNDLFDDDDGFLFQRNNAGTDKYNLISKMTSTEVRQFISPSLSVMPSQSLIVIPKRFGFSSHTPSQWRNRPSTKEKLEKYH